MSQEAGGGRWGSLCGVVHRYPHPGAHGMIAPEPRIPALHVEHRANRTRLEFIASPAIDPGVAHTSIPFNDEPNEDLHLVPAIRINRSGVAKAIGAEMLRDRFGATGIPGGHVHIALEPGGHRIGDIRAMSGMDRT